MEIKMLVTMLRNAADELERIEGAVATLQGLEAGSRRKSKGKGTRKPMSAEARAKIAAAQKKRWAKAKKES